MFFSQKKKCFSLKGSFTVFHRNPFHLHGFKFYLQMEEQMERRNRKWPWLVLEKKKLREIERFSEEVCRDSDKHKVCMGSRCVFHVSGKSTAGCSWVAVYLSMSFLCPLFQHSWEPLHKLKYVRVLYWYLNLIANFHFHIWKAQYVRRASRIQIWRRFYHLDSWVYCSCCNNSIIQYFKRDRTQTDGTVARLPRCQNEYKKALLIWSDVFLSLLVSDS